MLFEIEKYSLIPIFDENINRFIHNNNRLKFQINDRSGEVICHLCGNRTTSI